MPPEVAAAAADPDSRPNSGKKSAKKKAVQKPGSASGQPGYQMNAQQKAILAAVAHLNANESLYFEAIKKSEEKMGPKHPDVLAKCSKLADLFFHTMRFGDAVPLLQKALDIQLEIDPSAEGEIAKLENNLGAALRKSGSLEEALPLHQKAVESTSKIFGRDHANTDTAKSNLVGLLQEMGRRTEAIDFLQQVANEEEAQPENSPNRAPRIAGALRGLALVQLEEKLFKDAEPNLQRAHEMFVESFGEQHPATGSTLAALAQVLKNVERFEEAEERYQQLLTLNVQALGPMHMQSAMTMHTLAKLKSERGKHAEALGLMEDAVTATRESQHQMAISDFLNSLAQIAKAAGDEQRAETAQSESDELKAVVATAKAAQEEHVQKMKANQVVQEQKVRQVQDGADNDSMNATQDRLRKKLEARKQGAAALTPRSSR